MRDFEQSIIINEKIKLEERFEFRTIFSEEAVQAASVERVCFPPNEACTEEMMKQRALKNCFLWRLTEKAVKWQVF